MQGTNAWLDVSQITWHTCAMELNLAQKLIAAIGQDVLTSQAVGISERNLRHIKSVGYFPIKWYPPVKEVADIAGVHCPLAAFVATLPIYRRGDQSRPVQDAAHIKVNGTASHNTKPHSVGRIDKYQSARQVASKEAGDTA